MDHGPDKGDDDVTDDIPSRPKPSVPPTGGVRIIGAETAAEITSEVPVVPPAHITPDSSTHSSVRILEEGRRGRGGADPGADRTAPLDRAPDRPGASRAGS